MSIVNAPALSNCQMIFNYVRLADRLVFAGHWMFMWTLGHLHRCPAGTHRCEQVPARQYKQLHGPIILQLILTFNLWLLLHALDHFIFKYNEGIEVISSSILAVHKQSNAFFASTLMMMIIEDFYGQGSHPARKVQFFFNVVQTGVIPMLRNYVVNLYNTKGPLSA